MGLSASHRQTIFSWVVVSLGGRLRHGPRRQAISTLTSEGGNPAADATGIHAEEVGDRLDGVTLVDSLDVEPTMVLQYDRWAWSSHASNPRKPQADRA